MNPALRSTFRILKGAPLTVLIALYALGGEAGLLELCALTSYTDKTVLRALHALSDAKLVTRRHYHSGYTLTRGGRQLPLLLSGRNLSDLAADLGENPLLAAFNPESNSNSHLQDPEAASSRKKPEIDPALDALYRAWGIHGKTRRELTCAGRLTPAQAHKIHARWKRRNAGVGLLVVMLRKDTPEPSDEDRCRAYVEGEFADFIEH